MKGFLHRMKKDLGISDGDGDSSDEDSQGNKEYASAIKLIYRSSAMQILKVAMKLFQGSSFVGEVPSTIHIAASPDDGPRELQLGDWVEISVSFSDFKTIQKETLGWNARLETVHGHIGIITGMRSKYDNSINLFFPDVFAGCDLHAGILRKVDRQKYENYETPWKPGDMVKTIADDKVLLLLQRGLGPIPSEFQGKKGRVISISKRSVEVTFDGLSCFHVHPAGVIISDDKTPIQQEMIEHDRGFVIGEKVRMVSNMKRLIGNQKRANCDWETEMSVLCGKEVTITSIQSDGTVYVQLPQRDAWKVSPDSVFHLSEDDPLYSEELGFAVEDIVKIKRSNDLQAILTKAKIPPSFLEYLRIPAKVGNINKEFDCFLLFNAEQHIQASPKALRKATSEESTRACRIQDKVKNLKPGDTVHLDVGPPSYVRDVLKLSKVDPSVVTALTQSATLIGFLDQHNAVIEYDKKLRFRINKKYLTIPDKFGVTSSKVGIDLETVCEIKEVISKSLEDLHDKKELGKEGWNVGVLAMTHGTPSTVELRVVSMEVKPQEVYEWLLENSGWKIKYHDEGKLLVRGVRGLEEEIKLGIYFNDEKTGFLSIMTSAGVGSATDEY